MLPGIDDRSCASATKISSKKLNTFREDENALAIKVKERTAVESTIYNSYFMNCKKRLNAQRAHTVTWQLGAKRVLGTYPQIE